MEASNKNIKISQGKVPVDIKKLIIKYKDEGKSYAEIAGSVGRSRSTVQSVVKNYKKNQSFNGASGRGRKSVLSEHMKRKIERLVKTDPKIGAPKITAQLKKELNIQVSPQTVRNFLHSKGYKGCIARKKPFLSKQNVAKRLDYAMRYVNKPEEFWNSVVFVDESKYNIFGSDGRRTVWRQKGAALNSKNMIPTVKHGGGNVMVWGAMGAGGVGDLVFVETTMNKEQYLQILRDHLKSSARKIGISGDFSLVQDNDPKHASHLVKNWLIYNIKSTLPHPPQSPDLNPIEHLWDNLEKRVRQHDIRTRAELKSKLISEWHQITSEETGKLVHSMQNRLKQVIAQKGWHTNY